MGLLMHSIGIPCRIRTFTMVQLDCNAILYCIYVFLILSLCHVVSVEQLEGARLYNKSATAIVRWPVVITLAQAVILNAVKKFISRSSTDAIHLNTSAEHPANSLNTVRRIYGFRDYFTFRKLPVCLRN